MVDGEEKDEHKIEQNDSCFSWKEMNKLVILPNSNAKVTWDLFANLAICFSILVSSTMIAFHGEIYDHMWKQELIVDIILLFDMILYFFTAIEGGQIEDTRYNTNLKQIMVNYLQTYFILDFVAVVPILTMTVVSLGIYGSAHAPAILQ